MNLLKKSLRMAALLAGIVCLGACSDDDDKVPAPEEQPQTEYCLVFYGMGGDVEHDLSMMQSFELGARATAHTPHVAMVVQFQASGKAEGKAHNGTRRYVAREGRLVEDPAFSPGEDFNGIDPANITAFLDWAAAEYPNRKYILGFAGHGNDFDPRDEFREQSTRATLYNGKRPMTSADFGRALRDATMRPEGLIAHSCLQGCGEYFAEWEDLADYFLCSPFNIPDMAYDYEALIEDLENGYNTEEALVRTARCTMNRWSDFHIDGGYGTVVEVVRMNRLAPVWEALRGVTDEMKAIMDETCITTDPPAVYGKTFRESFYDAYQATVPAWEEGHPFHKTAPEYSIDLPLFLRNCYAYSGSLSLAAPLNRLDAAMEEALAWHGQSDGGHEYTMNACTIGIQPNQEKYLGMYRATRFNQLTGWLELMEEVMKAKPAE